MSGPWRDLTAFAAVVLVVTFALLLVPPLRTGAPSAPGPTPQPSPSPVCAQLVDFPDADPPRYGVCVPADQAG